MDQVIWIEILSRHRDVAHRMRFAGAELHIGRGYDNDVVVDDPYVAPQHLRVFRDEAGRLVAEDLGSANGLFVDGSRHQRVVIDGERPIRIGHTQLRIREASHAVPPERVGSSQAHILPITLAAGLGIVILGIEALSAWVAETGEPKASHYLAPLFAIIVVVLIWVSGWALLSRIFSGRASFERNLLIALWCVLAFSLYNELAQFAAFALTWRIAISYDYVVTSLILAAACFFHLREVSSSRLKLKGALVVMLFGLAIAVQTLNRSEAFDDSGRQNTYRRLMPPMLRLAPVRDEGAFLAGIDRLKTELDRDRTQARDDDAVR